MGREVACNVPTGKVKITIINIKSAKTSKKMILYLLIN